MLNNSPIIFINQKSTSKCIICNSNIGNIITNKLEHYCEMCWYHEHSPVLVLAILWDYVQLFDPESKKFVSLSVKQLERCGFRLFKRTVFFNRKINPRYKEVLVYKYSGHLRCLALSGYNTWPSKMPNCCKIGCTLKDNYVETH